MNFDQSTLRKPSRTPRSIVRVASVIMCVAAAVFAVGTVSASGVHNPKAPLLSALDQQFRAPMGPDAEMMAALKSAEISTRIYGGGEATATQNPFHVAILVKSVTNNFAAYLCGGTLYKANIVITAAHCVGQSASTYQVLTGTRKLDGTGTRRNVQSIVKHSLYNSVGPLYDVAVLRLSSSATGHPTAQLPPSATDAPVGTNMRITGWGALCDTSCMRPTNLYSAIVPTVARTVCGGGSPSTICASGAGLPDACGGDSGGPMASGNILYGIISGGDACGTGYGVYARVSEKSIRDFIINNSR